MNRGSAEPLYCHHQNSFLLLATGRLFVLFGEGMCWVELPDTLGWYIEICAASVEDFIELWHFHAQTL